MLTPWWKEKKNQSIEHDRIWGDHRCCDLPKVERKGCDQSQWVTWPLGKHTSSKYRPCPSLVTTCQLVWYDHDITDKETEAS